MRIDTSSGHLASDEGIILLTALKMALKAFGNVVPSLVRRPKQLSVRN